MFNENESLNSCFFQDGKKNLSNFICIVMKAFKRPFIEIIRIVHQR